MEPAGEKFKVKVSAKDWRLPAGPPIHFQTLDVTGVASPTEADFRDIKASLYGGSIAGRIAVGWQKGLQLKGDFAVKGVELRDLVPLFSPQTRLSGRLTAKPVFTANAPKPDQIANVMKLETPFDIQGGVLKGVDIEEAATSRKGSGGETRFDALSGYLAMDRGTQRLTELKVESGSMGADGHVTIAQLIHESRTGKPMRLPWRPFGSGRSSNRSALAAAYGPPSRNSNRSAMGLGNTKPHGLPA